jgi:hypothetical protein
MPVPNLINFVDVTVEQIDKAATIYDPDSREPIQSAARAVPFTIKGRPKWLSSKELQVMDQGAADQARGYVLFRVVDLVAQGVTIAIGDRVTVVGVAPGVTDQEVYITRLQPTAYWADQGGHTLLKAWFTDREPSKERAS